MKNYINLIKNKKCDKNVILGYMPERKIKNKKLTIGDNLRLRSGTVIYLGSKIGKNFQSGHDVVIREENRIGDSVSIWSHTLVDYGCNIGNNVKIHCNVYIGQFSTIEDDCFIAPGVIMANDPCPVCTKCMKGPTIKRGARIGVNATLLPHIIIGEGALIGAGSVVTKNVPAHALVYGNPAKVIKQTSRMKCKYNLVERPYPNG